MRFTLSHDPSDNTQAFHCGACDAQVYRTEPMANPSHLDMVNRASGHLKTEHGATFVGHANFSTEEAPEGKLLVLTVDTDATTEVEALAPPASEEETEEYDDLSDDDLSDDDLSDDDLSDDDLFDIDEDGNLV